MANFAKSKLSGSTSGKQILLTAITNGTAQTIHTAVASAGANTWDEVWLYATNVSTLPVLLTILWGGTTEPDNAVKIYIPAQSGRIEICDGMLLQNSLVVKAYAFSASVIVIDGFVNNIT